MANWGRVAWLVVLAGSVMAAAPAGAGGAPAGVAPSLRIETSLSGQALPVAAANTAGWTSNAGIWTVSLHSASAAGGETQIDSSWASPTFHARPHQVYFAFNIDVAHQGAPSRVISFEQRVRICFVGGGCSRWSSISANDLPDEYTFAAPYQVTSGVGQALGTLGNTFRGYAQFRFHEVQRGFDEQAMTMRVAVGAAASRLERQSRG